ncbi:hypothetical protein PCASD_14732 [Puccinia coronata f. sp. avenae]|uniref:Uncharacterized protein n=2 Tax=Puccinia coronata f. sp. avenae TaxID=200324 RepID=A0A2N5TD69_9BASI|nr:hypothetical protein PCASD_14732 [Puccinia coronata f. sp. avenae]
MSHVIKSTAQWINKPKFHILFHLPESISRAGGPPSLFATEKFESFNGVLRNSSTHSNKQAPGHDIAVNFANYQALRFLLSGGIKYNQATQSTSSCSSQIRDFFRNNPIVQKSLGFNPELLNPTLQYPYQKRTMLDQKDAVSIPTSLANRFPSNSINQISQVQLNAHEVIHKSVFILITGERMEEYVGMVSSLWIANGQFFVL